MRNAIVHVPTSSSSSSTREFKETPPRHAARVRDAAAAIPGSLSTAPPQETMA